MDVFLPDRFAADVRAGRPAIHQELAAAAATIGARIEDGLPIGMHE